MGLGHLLHFVIAIIISPLAGFVGAILTHSIIITLLAGFMTLLFVIIYRVSIWAGVMLHQTSERWHYYSYDWSKDCLNPERADIVLSIQTINNECVKSLFLMFSSHLMSPLVGFYCWFIILIYNNITPYGVCWCNINTFSI